MALLLASDAKSPAVQGLSRGVLGGWQETTTIRRKREFCIDDESSAGGNAAKKQRVELPIPSSKLTLVLDLDLTLLNSVEFDRVDPADKRVLRKKLMMREEKGNCDLFCVDRLRYWTKLRPGAREFLRKVSQMFDLYIVTMGTRLYATAMAELLDPTGNLFSGKILSREDASIDDHGLLVKSLDRVATPESKVLILDDTVRVWPRNQWNLIHIKRYAYFPYTWRKYVREGDSPFYTAVDDDDVLASIFLMLEKIHGDYHLVHQYVSNVDIRNILASNFRG